MLERKRQAIRRALKMQYIKTAYDPRNYTREGSAPIFDAAMARFHAMHATRGDFFYPTFRLFCLYVVPLGLTIGGMTYWVFKEKTDMHAAIQKGELPYDHPDRKRKWGNR